MNSIQRQRNSGGGPDEVEALQTDVMRFLAIICMCLMIVFSLVQSMPVAKTGNQPDISGSALTMDELNSLEERAKTLKQQMREMESQLAEYQDHLKELETSLVQQESSLKDLEAQRKSKEQEILKKQVVLDQTREQINAAYQTAEQYQEMIRDIKLKYQQELMTLSQVKNNIIKARAEMNQAETIVDKLQEKILESLKTVEAAKPLEPEPVKEPVKPEPEPVKEPVKPEPVEVKKPPEPKPEKGVTASKPVKEVVKPVKPVKPEPVKSVKPPKPQPAQQPSKPEKSEPVETVKKPPQEREGFSLRFESNSALEHLLKNDQRVKLYLMAGGNSWLLKSHGGTFKFFPDKAPSSIYEMDINTVPQKIIWAGKKVVAAFGKDQVTYGVTLAPDIRNKLGKLMEGHTGGDLVIASNASVKLE